MLTTSVYAGLALNPPAIGFMGKKTWTPGKTLPRFITATFGIALREQQQMVQAITDAVADTAQQVHGAMAQHADFAALGTRMLAAWAEGVRGLRDQRIYALGEATSLEDSPPASP
jgi:serine/threonine-protein kinase HipA